MAKAVKFQNGLYLTKINPCCADRSADPLTGGIDSNK